MSISDLFARLRLREKDAEIIFDRDEPIGQPTDMVMPRRRWFRKEQPPTGGARHQNSARVH